MNIKWIITITVLLIAKNDGVSGKDVRVKLCGREFIRMVVTLCGSSRLRRDAPEINPESINPHGGSFVTNFVNRNSQLNIFRLYHQSFV